MNIPLLSILAVTAMLAPILWHVVNKATFLDPTPPHPPGLGVALSGLGAELLVLLGHHVVRLVVVVVIVGRSHVFRECG